MRIPFPGKAEIILVGDKWCGGASLKTSQRERDYCVPSQKTDGEGRKYLSAAAKRGKLKAKVGHKERTGEAKNIKQRDGGASEEEAEATEGTQT